MPEYRSIAETLASPAFGDRSKDLSRAATLLLTALLLSLAACAALLADMSVARWISSGYLPGDLQRLIALSEAFAHGSGVALILLAAAAIDPRTWRVLPRLILGAFGAGLLADVLKLVLARTRPRYFDLDQSVWDSFMGLFAWRTAPSWQEAFVHQVQSMPSGHAATAAGLACALSRLYPRASWFFVLMTLLACFQRMESGAHYLSDVLAGAAVGVLLNAVLELPRVRPLLERVESP